MDEWIDEWIDGWGDESMDGQKNEWRNERMIDKLNSTCIIYFYHSQLLKTSNKDPVQSSLTCYSLQLIFYHHKYRHHIEVAARKRYKHE